MRFPGAGGNKRRVSLMSALRYSSFPCEVKRLMFDMVMEAVVGKSGRIVCVSLEREVGCVRSR